MIDNPAIEIQKEILSALDYSIDTLEYQQAKWRQSLGEAIGEYGIPGLSVALIHDQTISSLEWGVKNSQSQDPVVSSTVFEGASLSKPLIAYAALQLCKEGLLNLDLPLHTYLSPLDDNPYLAVLTLRHILSHTSGFPTGNLKPGEPLILESKPGNRFAYSGESFRYLGRIIEQITGMDLATYMQNHVFYPLQMEDSSFVWEERYAAQIASPHNGKGQPMEKWRPSLAIASCSLHTTASDFAKFMIRAQQEFPEMSSVSHQVNESIGWGLGWGIEMTSDGSQSIWHSGDNGTFQCLAFQNGQIGFVILTNSVNGMKIYRQLFPLLVGGHHPLLDWEQFDFRAEEEQDENFLANWWKAYGF